ncbi:MAG: nitronate monooxygenase family protein [Candidatus Pacearchaeota archaeon]|nr:nitronate monooxygenase family protein [Candidatus Pacearchaeota archaeon]
MAEIAEWDFPVLKFGTEEKECIVIQGGMGVGVSKNRLVSAVANEGAIGVIAAVGLDVLRDWEQTRESGAMALKEEIKLTRSMMIKGKDCLGVNIMYALSNYKDLVRASLEEEVDVIFLGAGVSRNLPRYAIEIGNTHTKLVPIVSSARLAKIVCEDWGDRYGRLPDAIVLEGPKAGGHLGFHRYNPKKPLLTDNLDNPDFVSHGLERLIPEVVEAVKPFETERKIPIIVAGGIFYGGDIKKVRDLGAAGVQMATRFVTTYECDASKEFKQAYLDCKKEDIVVTDSPVGMPIRVIKNKFIDKAIDEVIAGTRKPIDFCPYQCLKTCNPKNPAKSPYCIARALVAAQTGDFDNGFACAGLNADLCGADGMKSVHELFKRLKQEYKEGKRRD